MEKPKYEWVEEEGVENITPVKRKINKTMVVTESFNFYDVLAYCMKMEKAIEDKEAEADGLRAMVKAYKDELELVEKELGVTDFDAKWNLALHEKLKEEEEAKKLEEGEKKEEELIESPYASEEESK